MKITITAIGKQLKPWMEDGIDSYLKRTPKGFQIKVNTLAPYKTNQKNSDELIKQKEAEKLLSHTKSNEFIICLDEKGKQFDTSQWKKELENITLHSNVHFLIGGAYGLDQSIKHKAHAIWSLGKITLPHGLARLILIEQLYRVFCLIQNHPYHKP